MSRTTQWLPVAVMTSGAMMLAACSGGGTEADGGDSASGASGDEITLNVAVWSDWGFMQRAADAYTQENPNVTVQVDAIPSGDYFASLPRTLGTEGAPDITVAQVLPNGPYQDIVQDGGFVDVSDIWEELDLENNMTDTAVDNYTQEDGTRWAVDVGPTFLPMTLYNKDLFAELGIEVEDGGQLESAEELYAIADTLEAAGVTPMVYPWGGDDAQHYFQQIVLSSCGEDFYNSLGTAWRDDEDSAAKWDDPCVINAIESLKAADDEGIYGQNPLVDRDVAQAAFLSENAGMFNTGMFVLPGIAEGADFEYGWFMNPPAEGGEPTQWVLFTVDGLAINAASDHVEEARDFLATVVTQEFQSSMLLDGRPPSRTDISVPDGAEPVLPAMLQSFEEYGTAVHIVQIETPIDYVAVIVAGMQEVLQGTTSPEELATRLEDLTTELRADNS